jgi:hypothetical protein
MGKKGDISLSFGMIFSILVIISVIAIAFYVISYFLNLQKCTNVSLFYEDFQNEMDDAWRSEITQDRFIGKVPGSIEKVCLRHELNIGRGSEFEELKDYGRSGENVFLYPPNKACKRPAVTIEHIDLSEIGWACFDVVDGKVALEYEKGSFDSLVRIKEAK